MDEIWMAEFRGFFYGEGCAYVQRFTRRKDGKSHVFYRPQLKMCLRADDRPMLDDIQQHLGGTVTSLHLGWKDYQNGTKLGCGWNLCNKEDVVRACNILLAGKMPSAKMHQIKLVKEAAEMRAGRAYQKLTEPERKRLDELYWMCRWHKQFKQQVG